MGHSSRQSAGKSVWEFAARQHGVVEWEQLRGLGLSGGAIRHRVERGRLHPVARGVYAVGRPSLDRHGEWMAAVLSSGSTAVLSHWSAAALWGFGTERGRVDISVLSHSHRENPGIRMHRRPSLRESDLSECNGIPVTSPIRALIDIAAYLNPASIERAVNEADRLDLVHLEDLRTALDSYRGQRGVARLRKVLDRATFRLTDSELERRFLRLVADVGLTPPLTRRYVNGFRVDFYWPDLRFVVETDGLRYHRTPAQQARDRLRDQAHTVAGLTPLRFTHAQVRFEAVYVRSTLSEVARRLEGTRAA